MSGPPPGPRAGLLTPPGTEEDAYEIRRRSQELRRLGFQQTEIVDPSTGRPALMWARVWRGLRDAVIANADGAVAYRIWDIDFDADNPFMTEPDLIMSSSVGSFLDVSAQMLAQEPPAEHSRFPNRWRRDATAGQLAPSDPAEQDAELAGQHVLASRGSG